MANTTIGNAYLQIVPSAKGIQGSITDALNGEAGNAGASMSQSLMQKLVPSLGNIGTNGGMAFASKLVAAAAAFGLAAKLKNMVSDAVSEGANLEQSLGGVEAIFQGSADKVKAYAAQSWESVGVSANEYMEGVTSFSAALINSMGGDTDRAADIANQAFIDMGDNANRFGTDMASIQNAYQGFAKQNYTMLDNLKLGYGGTKSEMERLLKDAQEISGIEYNLDNLGDVYSAIHVIQEELNVTGTTANEAASTLTGSSAAMKAAWSDLLGQAALGMNIGPALQNVSTSVTTWLSNLVPMVIRSVSQLIPALANLIFQIPAKLLPQLPALIGQIVTGVGRIIAGVLQAIIIGIPSIVAGFIQMFKNAIDAVKNIDWKGLGTSIINWLKDTWEGLKAVLPDTLVNIAQTAWDFVSNVDWLGLGKAIINFIVNGIKFLITNIPQLLKTIGTTAFNWLRGINWLQLGKTIIAFIGNGIKALITSIPQLLKNIGTTAWNWLKNVNWLQLGRSIITFIVNGIKGLVSAIPSALKSIGTAAWQRLRNVNWLSLGRSIISAIVSGIKGLFSSIPSALRSIGSSAMSTFKGMSWSSVGSAMISGIKSGISSAASSLFGAVSSVASNALGAAKRRLGIASPSKVFRDVIGVNISEGIAEGVYKGAPSALTAIDDLTSEMQNTNLPNLALNQSATAFDAATQSGYAGNTYIINIDAEMDGTPIKTKVGQYIINKIGQDQRAELRAQGI